MDPHSKGEFNATQKKELFRARTIAFLVNEGLLPPERAQMLRSWKHAGFNVHRSKRVEPCQREDLERLAQYIIRTRSEAGSRE